jgi:hypothetical protein
MTPVDDSGGRPARLRRFRYSSRQSRRPLFLL